MTEKLYKIRPLKFIHSPYGYYEAETPFGSYTADTDLGKLYWRASENDDFDLLGAADAADDLMRMAEDDWRNRLGAVLNEHTVEPDWWYRDLDPDECGYSPHEALRWTRDYRVDMLHSSYRGPTKFAFRAPVIGDPDEDEVLLFDTEAEALAAAEERYAALQMKGGDHDR